MLRPGVSPRGSHLVRAHVRDDRQRKDAIVSSTGMARDGPRRSCQQAVGLPHGKERNWVQARGVAWARARAGRGVHRDSNGEDGVAVPGHDEGVSGRWGGGAGAGEVVNVGVSQGKDKAADREMARRRLTRLGVSRRFDTWEGWLWTMCRPGQTFLAFQLWLD